MMRKKRQGLVVWFKHRRNIKQIKRYGHLIYTSRRLKYAVLYVDQDEIKVVEEKLRNHSFILKVMQSHKPQLRTDFEKVKPDKEEKYNYKIGRASCRDIEKVS